MARIILLALLLSGCGHMTPDERADMQVRTGYVAAHLSNALTNLGNQYTYLAAQQAYQQRPLVVQSCYMSIYVVC